MAFILISVITVTLFVTGLVSINLGPVARILVIGQCLFWFVSFALRPAILLIVEPQPKLNDSLADFRIADFGYQVGAIKPLQLIAFGLVAYLFALWILSRRIFGLRDTGPASNALPLPARVFTDKFARLMFMLGWGFRVGFVVTGGADFGETNTFAIFAPIATVGVAWILHRGARLGGGAQWATTLLLGFSELAWSAMAASKNPIVAFSLILLVTWSVNGWKKIYSLFTVIIGFFTFSVFPILQSLKFSEKVRADLANVDIGYPWWSQSLLPIIRRFDLFSAVVDANYYGSATWLNPTEYLGRLAQTFVPTFIGASEKVGAGTSWSTEVASRSIGVVNQNVSLAEGFIGEGYALNGFIGITVESFLVAALVLICARFLFSPKPFLGASATILIAQTALFERGSLGIAESLSVSIKGALVVALVTFIASRQSSMGANATPPERR